MPDERAAAFIANTQSSRTWVKSMDLRHDSLTSKEPLIKSVPCLFKEKWPFPTLQTCWVNLKRCFPTMWTSICWASTMGKKVPQGNCWFRGPDLFHRFKNRDQEKNSVDQNPGFSPPAQGSSTPPGLLPKSEVTHIQTFLHKSLRRPHSPLPVPGFLLLMQCR